MVVNFNAYRISWGTHKLTQTPTLIIIIIIIKAIECYIGELTKEKKKKKKEEESSPHSLQCELWRTDRQEERTQDWQLGIEEGKTLSHISHDPSTSHGGLKTKMVDRGQAVALVSQVCLSMKGTQPFTWAYITLLLRFLNLLRYSIKPISSIIALLCYNTLFLFYPYLKADQKKGGNRK
jgi:hypothetical protein